jgi:hypothetical protein
MHLNQLDSALCKDDLKLEQINAVAEEKGLVEQV